MFDQCCLRALMSRYLIKEIVIIMDPNVRPSRPNALGRRLPLKHQYLEWPLIVPRSDADLTAS